MNQHSSIIFFTIEKSASVYMIGVLQKLSQELGMTYLNYEGDFWVRGEEFKGVISDPKKTEEFLNPCGCIYGPFRGFYPEIPNIEKYKVILMLRDPRDVLTSLYFSSAYSHHIPPAHEEKMMQFRKEAIDSRIDDYVLNKIHSILGRYYEYAQHCLGKEHVLFVKYEEMVSDFSGWLNTVIDFLEIEVSQEFINKLVKEADFKVAEENPYAHKRQVTPGDHKRKLRVKTIVRLSLEFQEILKKFNWVSNGIQEELELYQLNLDRARKQLKRSQVQLQQHLVQLKHK
ncbi:MAG: sulfotransferase domain-containing protein [Microcoleus sp.]